MSNKSHNCVNFNYLLLVNNYEINEMEESPQWVVYYWEGGGWEIGTQVSKKNYKPHPPFAPLEKLQQSL